jgi:uncharacterized protein (DUF1697 family)
MAKYVAFLRGINVGGNKKVPMAKLKSVLEEFGFKNVRTLLASGNVIFESKKDSLPSLTKKISATLEEAFSFTIPVILRDADQIEKIAGSDPFKNIIVTKDTRLYVTFLSEEPKSKLKIPYISPDKSFQILAIKDKAIFSIVDLSKAGTVEAMAILEKEFGKNITTRNWNTIVKIVSTYSV